MLYSTKCVINSSGPDGTLVTRSNTRHATPTGPGQGALALGGTVVDDLGRASQNDGNCRARVWLGLRLGFELFGQFLICMYSCMTNYTLCTTTLIYMPLFSRSSLNSDYSVLQTHKLTPVQRYSLQQQTRLTNHSHLTTHVR